MSPITQRFSPLFGILLAAISILLVLGGAYTSLQENRPAPARPVPPTPTLSFPTPLLLTPGQPTPTRVMQPPTATIPPPAACPPPAGWTAITVQSGETLDSLAVQYGTDLQILKAPNCLSGQSLPVGAILYVPAPPTAPVIQCGPPPGWVFYTVQPGENLFRIGLAFGVSVTTLQQANCLGNNTAIRAGQRLYVPNVPTITPALASQTPTFTASPSTTPYAATVTPTFTFTPSPTSTNLVPTLTPSPTPTNPPVSPTFSPTAAITATLTATVTPIPSTATLTPIPPTATLTPLPPSPTSSVGTPTFTPTSTSTWTPTPTPTLLLLPTPTP